MGTVDRKRRLAADVARDRSWVPASVSIWVVVGESKTNRRCVQTHADVKRAFPLDGRQVQRWLGAADRSARLSFWPSARAGHAKSDLATVKRVRRLTGARA